MASKAEDRGSIPLGCAKGKEMLKEIDTVDVYERDKDRIVKNPFCNYNCENCGVKNTIRCLIYFGV